LTAVSGALSAVGVVMVASMEPGWSVAIAATIALLLGYAFDSADGQLARLRGSGGPAGEWLDHVVDAARQPVIHVAALIYLYRFWDESSVWLLAPICFLVVTTARFLSQVLAEQLRRGSGQIGPAGGAGGERRAVLQLPADPGMLCLVFATAGNPLVFVWAYGMLAVVNIAIGLVSFRRRFAELGALEVEREGEASTPATPAEPVGPP
jgi:phosphatidylglycerophosphate synthase